MKKKGFKGALAIMLVLVFTSGIIFAAGSTETAEKPARKLSIAHVFATNHPVHIALLEANEQLKEKSGGRLELNIYPNGTYANYNDAVQAVIMGQLDMAPLDSASEYLPKSGVLLGPYVFRSYGHWTNFKNSDLYENLKDDISKAVGVKQLDLYNFGFRNMTGNRPLTKLEDFQKLKLRVVNFPPYSEIATVFNAIGTSLPIGDVYMGLQAGVVDAQENPLTQIVTMKFYEVQKYLMITQHMLAVAGTIMSEQTWNSLSAEDQQIVEEVFRFEADRIDQIVRDNENALIDEVKKAGMTVVDKIDTKPFRDRVGLVLERNPSWVELYNQIQQIPD
ncbi:TRAP transporter substrate-binding protein [Sphaerochaeta sp.]|uniref:TRAP transporter substrate-binding protein n=1 Tax=Sphaerochaeta sp. TaxID=1972642 RepID=UPI003D13FB59